MRRRRYLCQYLHHDRCVRINAETGQVEALIDASSLPNNATPDPNNVLNGIAHIPGSDNEFYLSGKRWPDLYRVTFEPK